MPAVTFSRRVVSTPTSVTVGGLPAWIAAIPAGSWSNSVALNSTSSITTSAGSGNWPAGRNLDTLFSDYTGAIWNPYYSTHGAWILHGGGHSNGGFPRLDNGVYAWDATSRLWVELRQPTYPGQLSLSWWPGGANQFTDNQSAMDSPVPTYGELEVGVPISNHSRWSMCVLSPSEGGGSKGSIVLTRLSSGHITGTVMSEQAKVFDCNTGTWSRFGPLPASDSGTSAGACTDTLRGRVIRSSRTQLRWIAAANPTAWSANCAPASQWDLANWGQRPIIYAPNLDVFITLNGNYGFFVFTAAELYSATIPVPSTRLPTVSAPSGLPGVIANEGYGLDWCQALGANGAFVCLEYVSPYRVFACYAPSNPISGTWVWSILSSSNTPSFSWSGYDGPGQTMYNKFQYSGALKAFFVCTTGTQNMWCFRPSEIP